MWSSFLLRKHSKRMFSTFSKVQSNAILLSSTTPTRIKIPVNGENNIDYSIDQSLTVQEFSDKLKQENQSISNFEIEGDQTQEMDTLLQKRFEMKVNNKNYTVHPDLTNMVNLKNRNKVEEILGAHEFPLVRRSIIAMFLDHLVSYLPKDPVSKQQLKQILENAAKEYDPKSQEEMLTNIKGEIKNTETELEDIYERRKKFEVAAKSYANNMLLFGVGMAAGQVGGFGYLIYGLYTWDDMEPVTYLVGAFYACVSMAFYFRYKEDWDWT